MMLTGEVDSRLGGGGSFRGSDEAASARTRYPSHCDPAVTFCGGDNVPRAGHAGVR